MTDRRSAARAARPDSSSLLEDLRTAAPFPVLRAVPAPAEPDPFPARAHGSAAAPEEAPGGGVTGPSGSFDDELMAARGDIAELPGQPVPVALAVPAAAPLDDEVLTVHGPGTTGRPVLRAMPAPDEHPGDDPDGDSAEAAEVPFRLMGRPPRPSRGTTPEMRVSVGQRWRRPSAHPLGDASGLVVAVGPLRLSIALA